MPSSAATGRPGRACLVQWTRIRSSPAPPSCWRTGLPPPTASALGLLTIEQQMEEIVVIPARGFALALDARLDGLVLAEERDRQPIEQRQVLDPVAVALPHPV